MPDNRITSSIRFLVDIEYDNGFRESVEIGLDKDYIMPFNGRVVGMVPILTIENEDEK